MHIGGVGNFGRFFKDFLAFFYGMFFTKNVISLELMEV